MRRTNDVGRLQSAWELVLQLLGDLSLRDESRSSETSARSDTVVPDEISGRNLTQVFMNTGQVTAGLFMGVLLAAPSAFTIDSSSTGSGAAQNQAFPIRLTVDRLWLRLRPHGSIRILTRADGSR